MAGLAAGNFSHPMSVSNMITEGHSETSNIYYQDEQPQIYLPEIIAKEFSNFGYSDKLIHGGFLSIGHIISSQLNMTTSFPFLTQLTSSRWGYMPSTMQGL